jgi:general secretion pathway protein L
MANPHAPLPLAQIDPSQPWRGGTGIWSLAGDRLVMIEEFGAGSPEAAPIVLMPSEHVLLLAAQLPPLASTIRRRDALPFAIEEHISEPLDQVHIALGAEMAPGIWLAGVVSHRLMARWLDMIADAGLERARLVPDAMALPVPGAGTWSVDLANERAVVRAEDGSGFAVPLALLDAAWSAAGKPAIVAYGEPLPAHFAATEAVVMPLAARLLAPVIDLRQGRYAAPRRPFHPLWKRIAIVAGLGALAHGAIAIADTIVLAHQAQARGEQVRALGASLQQPVEIGADLGDAIVALTPDPATAGSSRFTSLMARCAAALAVAQPGASPGAVAATVDTQAPAVWRSVSFDGAAGTLTIELETSNIADLQRMAQALTRAGLSAQPGSASTQGGKAVGT